MWCGVGLGCRKVLRLGGSKILIRGRDLVHEGGRGIEREGRNDLHIVCEALHYRRASIRLFGVLLAARRLSLVAAETT